MDKRGGGLRVKRREASAHIRGETIGKGCRRFSTGVYVILPVCNGLLEPLFDVVFMPIRSMYGGYQNKNGLGDHHHSLTTPMLTFPREESISCVIPD